MLAALSSLDVLDYQAGLEAALARPGPDGRPLLPPALRRSAMREARRTIEALAFRFALMDERPLPEDLDFLRALEAMKDPPRAAVVLARRRDVYARTRRRRLATTWTILLALGLFVGGLAYLATLEEADELAYVNERGEAGLSVERKFLVDANHTRLRIDGTFIVPRDSAASIEVFLQGPGGEARFWSFDPGGNNYLRENVPAVPGEWRLIVDYGGAGSAQVVVLGVRPAR